MAAHVKTILEEQLEKIGRLPEADFRKWVELSGLTVNVTGLCDDPQDEPFKLLGAWGHLEAFMQNFVTYGELESLLRQDLERLTHEWVGLGRPACREEWLKGEQHG